MNAQSLRKLSAEGLVNGLDYNCSEGLDFCESCTKAKHHRSSFPGCGGTRAEETLGLVHTDVCGKLDTKSLGGAQYFVTFIDDATRLIF